MIDPRDVALLSQMGYSPLPIEAVMTTPETWPFPPNGSLVSREQVQNMQREIEDLHAKVQYLVDYIGTHTTLEEGCFTFPDGDMWYQTGKEPHVR